MCVSSWRYNPEVPTYIPCFLKAFGTSQHFQEWVHVVYEKYDIEPTKINDLLFKRNASILNEKYIVLDTEKELLDSLIKIDKDPKEKIDILWETTDENLNQEFINGCFMEWAPHFLSQNFKFLIKPLVFFQNFKFCNHTFFLTINIFFLNKLSKNFFFLIKNG